MLVDVTSVSVLDGFRLRLGFDDGVVGEFDFGANVGFEGMLAPLRDPDYFSLVTVSPDLGTVVWPNGADLDPIVLHSAVLAAGQQRTGGS